MEEVVSSRKYLPPDLLIEILLRLDVKTLSRLCSVSKSWHALISDPLFRRSYECRGRRNPTLVVITSNCSNPKCSLLHLYSLDTKQGTLAEITSFDVHLVRPCVEFNHLGFVRVYDRYRSPSTYLCSPSTKELISLSPHSESIVAFGYVPSTDEYKALSITYVFKVLSSVDKEPVPAVGYRTSIISIGKDRKWRPVGNPPFDLLQQSGPLFDVALVDGAAHLLPGCRCPFNVGIARFDLEKEEWSVLPPLPFLPQRKTRLNLRDSGAQITHWSLSLSLNLRELGGRLCLLVKRKVVEHIVDIWLLRDYNNYVWVKEYNIDVSSYIVSFYGIRSSLYNSELVPLVIEDDGRVLLHMTDSRYGRYHIVNGLVFYDPRNGKFEDLNIMRKLSVAANHNNIYGSTFTTGFFSQTFMPLIGLPEVPTTQEEASAECD